MSFPSTAKQQDIPVPKQKQIISIEPWCGPKINILKDVCYICLLTSLAVTMAWWTVSDWNICHLMCSTPMPLSSGADVAIYAWILFKVKLLFAAFMTTAFALGYSVPTIQPGHDASPKDIKWAIDTNIKKWTAFHEKCIFPCWIYEGETNHRAYFAEYIAHPRITGSNPFGSPQMVRAAYFVLLGFQIPVLMYIRAVAYKETIWEVIFGEIGFKLLFLLSSLGGWYIVLQLGWSVKASRTGRMIRKKALRSEWNLGKGHEGVEEQLVWWAEKILEEDDDVQNTAKERFEKSTLPLISTVDSRLKSDEEPEYEDIGGSGERRCHPRILEAGAWKSHSTG
ncbi:hypothetical protein BKA61DRAFT_570940 [Leptodontidium sp. MPI-SDFR-AT-0119]|nr:hypothetical protein BKA61DRAFT_570940 [Leptodontidium sp. MPI-SDFR-AT-0119]